MEFDVIGDIHGQSAKLDALLRRLGYGHRAGNWVPPLGKQAVFIGDLIDRGPEQVKVVSTVRSMVDAGHARCVMGNHEFNALGYWTAARDKPDAFLRPHNQKNNSQHAEFLRQVGAGSELHVEMLSWFRSLPPALDLGGLRVVHDWWHQPYVDLVASRWRPGSPMDDDFLHAAHVKCSAEWRAMDGLTKGLEVHLPAPHSFIDHSGVERYEVRTKWWQPDAATFRDVAILGNDQRERLPELPLPEDYLGLPVNGAPVFVGHYWMTGAPALQSAKVACVDWSAAKDGPLVAYRWAGEGELDASNLVEAG